MKKLTISLFLVLAFLLGSAQKDISIKGNIKKSKTRKVWIYNYNKSISDTVKLNIFRRFNYSNSFAKGELCFVKPLESEIPLVFSINTESSIKFKTELPDIHGNLNVKGDNETSTASEFFNRMSQFQYRTSQTEEKLYKDETADGQYYYDSLLSLILVEVEDYKMEFVKANKNSSTLMLMHEFIDYENEYELMLELEKGLRNNHSNTEMYRHLSAEINKYQVFQTKVESKGEKAPMLILPGVNDKDLSMSSLSGNYILIDFWASWCAPCRAEHPRLIKLYEKYNKAGFEIYSISLDKSKEKWVNAITKDQLTWSSHVSNLRMFECPSVKMYDVKSLPFNVLVDREGYVIEFNLRGEKLEEKLKQIFDENK